MDHSPESMLAYQLHNGLTIFPAQDQALDRVLIDLVQNIPAHFALLTDRSGQIVSFRGDRGRIDLVALGALVAGDLAASQAIAQITNEYSDYQMVLRQGQHNNAFLTEAGQHLILLAQVAAEVPLGWARVLVVEAARQLDIILSTPPELGEETTPKPELEQSDLTDLFSQALDSMWSN
jgi:predicted regulator of Ras-like GTPase activity (Roadblock/LC7/MglB family)